MRLLCRAISEAKSDIRFASKVEMATGPRDVCFTPQSGHPTYCTPTPGATHVAKRTKQAYAVRQLKAAAMGQLLVMLIVPPIVGVVTYIVVRRIWDRDENGDAVSRREPSAVTQAEEKPMVHKRSVMSALLPKADMCAATRDVRYVPKADIGRRHDWRIN